MMEPDNRKADALEIVDESASGAAKSRALPGDDATSKGSMNDHQLLEAYFQGDEQAFETLVRKYFRMVYIVAARQTSDSHLAEEIAQSVFIILSRKGRGLSSRISIPGWLLRTTRFVCWDAIKMRRRRDQNDQKL